MKTRTNKHFLYTWLKEDKFAEFTLRKPFLNNLTRKILHKTWMVLTLSGRKLKRSTIRVRGQKWKTINRSIITYTKLQQLSLKKRNSKILLKTRVLTRSVSDSIALRPTPQKIVKSVKSVHYGKYADTQTSSPRSRSKKLFVLWGKSLGRLSFFNYKHLKKLGFRVTRRKRRRNLAPRFDVNLVQTNTARIKSLVPRHEIRTLKNIHSLRFYGTLDAPYNNLLKTTRRSILNKESGVNTFLTGHEMRLVTQLLRSGLIENAYITENIIKRGTAVLINGKLACSKYSFLKVWDIVTFTNNIWWYVYARLWVYSKRWLIRIADKHEKRYLSNTNFKLWKSYRSRNILIRLREINKNLRTHKKINKNYKKATITRNFKGSYERSTLVSIGAKQLPLLRKTQTKRPPLISSSSVLKYTFKYNKLKADLVYNSLLKKRIPKNTFLFLAKMKHFKNKFKLWHCSKFANKYNTIFPASPNLELSYSLLTFVVHRASYKSTDANIPSSLRLINRLNRVGAKFQVPVPSFIRNKNKSN